MSDAPDLARPDPQMVSDPQAFAQATGATPRAMADLEAYLALLTDWSSRMNLVGPSALAEFWPRHAYDSAQLLALAPQARTWADLGTGAGLPGLVLAILLKGVAGAQVHLVESLAKRCRFLQAVVDQLELPATVHNARAETLALKVDVVTARACAPLAKLLGFAKPYVDKGATGLFLKGQDVVSELTEATKYWKFEVQTTASLSASHGQIIRIERLRRVKG